MSLVMTSGPALEPVSLIEAKAHLRIDSSAEDALIQSLIVTSRLHIEAALGLALIAQSWSLLLDRWPKNGRLQLPVRPVLTVSQVRVWTEQGDPEILSPSLFILDGQGLPPRLVPLSGSFPAETNRTVNGIEVAFTAGFGATPEDVPATIRHALLLLVAHWYENREPIEIGAGLNAIPAMVSDLLAPYRRRRL
ncbi:MAG: phage head-tail connector protein [Proteobacteria bacterium]|nr:phage head-tail connector protein [Pseudomonadota bacterium]